MTPSTPDPTTEPTPATAPTEPPTWHLDRIEAAAQLVASTRCEHCAAEPQVVSWQPGTSLPRAISWRHQHGCPQAVAEDD